MSFHRIIFNLWRSGEAMNDSYSNPTASQPAASVEGHPEGTRTGDTVQGWTDTPPLPYRDDRLPPPYWWATDFYRRKRRRPRCGEIGGNDGR